MRYKPGTYIVSLDHLMGQELVYYCGKLLHKGWFGNWQLWYAKTELARLRIREAARNSRKGADKYHDLVTEMLETAIRRVGNEYADMLFEYDQQRRKAEKQCEQLAMEGMMKK